jgi:mRNA interferase HigB
LREFAALNPDAAQPLQDFRRKVEKGSYANFGALRAVFPSVDKVGERYVFNIGGNKYRLVAGIDFARRMVWVKAVLTHAEYDRGAWK